MSRPVEEEDVPTDDERGDPWSLDDADFPRDGPFEDQARFLLRYAILAPSSHNSQPWTFAIRDGAVDVFADDSRWLTVADPDRRELYLSVGCAVENLVVAATHFGFDTAVDYFPGDGDDHVATVELDPSGAPASHPHDGRFEAMTERYTNHHPYSDAPIPDDVRDRIRDCAVEESVAVRFVDDPETKAALGELQVRADERQFDDPAYRKELGYWIGTGALGASWLLARVGQVAVTYFDLGGREGRKNASLLARAPVLALLVTPTDDPAARVTAGRVFERASLAATDAALSVHPVSQILEVPEYRAALVDELGLAGRPQHLFRLGYAEEAEGHTPRRPLEDVLR